MADVRMGGLAPRCGAPLTPCPIACFSTLMAKLGIIVCDTCRTPAAGPHAPTFDVSTTPDPTQRHALDLIKQIRP
jgi:hypothetical protein